MRVPRLVWANPTGAAGSLRLPRACRLSNHKGAPIMITRFRLLAPMAAVLTFVPAAMPQAATEARSIAQKYWAMKTSVCGDSTYTRNTTFGGNTIIQVRNFDLVVQPANLSEAERLN